MLARRMQMAAAAGGVPPYLAGGAPDPLAVYAPMLAGSLAESYLRIAGTGGNENLDPAVVGSGVAPTWAAGTGWIGNSAAWLDTGLVWGNQYSALVRFSGYVDTGNNAGLMGCYLSSSPFTGLFLGKTTSTNTNRYRNGGTVFAGGGTQAAGIMATAGASAYFDGSEVSAALGGNGSNGLTIRILAAQSSGTAINFITANIQYVVIWDTSTDHATWMPAVFQAVMSL